MTCEEKRERDSVDGCVCYVKKRERDRVYRCVSRLREKGERERKWVCVYAM